MWPAMIANKTPKPLSPLRGLEWRCHPVNSGANPQGGTSYQIGFMNMLYDDEYDYGPNVELEQVAHLITTYFPMLGLAIGIGFTPSMCAIGLSWFNRILLIHIGPIVLYAGRN